MVVHSSRLRGTPRRGTLSCREYTRWSRDHPLIWSGWTERVIPPAGLSRDPLMPVSCRFVKGLRTFQGERVFLIWTCVLEIIGYLGKQGNKKSRGWNRDAPAIWDRFSSLSVALDPSIAHSAVKRRTSETQFLRNRSRSLCCFSQIGHNERLANDLHQNDQRTDVCTCGEET